MSTSTVKAIPEGFHSVTPYLVCAGAADAIEFYTKAFGATELMRVPSPNGKIMHAQIKIGNSILMLSDESPECSSLGPKALNGTPVSLYIYVEDADRAFEQAVSAGATVVSPMADMFWGDRWGHLTDPFGHAWHLATHIRDVDHADIPRAMQEASATQADNA
ncbi:VOC family protein [Trinickia sp. LjRoot230]|uniref:VOC family protein n=1 Tax=Trinickia sp. LjRoot230 TaxID=3342288 RepID=UPI003ECE7079